MQEAGRNNWGNPWFRWSVVALIVLTLFSGLVDFVLLPSVHGDYAHGLWASICRAAGVPAVWSDGSPPKSDVPIATDVMLERSMALSGAGDAVGCAATLALNCTMCHGAQGMIGSNAPNLAGQYPEVVIKQPHDYRNGSRSYKRFLPGRTDSKP